MGNLFFIVHVDINECEEFTGICGNGTCMNQASNYSCLCENDFQLSPDNTTCVGKYSQVVYKNRQKSFAHFLYRNEMLE